MEIKSGLMQEGQDKDFVTFLHPQSTGIISGHPTQGTEEMLAQKDLLPGEQESQS